AIDPPIVLFGLFLLFGLSGYAIYLWRLIKGKPVSIVDTQTHHEGNDKEPH
ncbi:MAG: CDP-diacylglycerol--serine O-phosphatidyltransferase, partial [Burkholderiaceae bacterium]|nr:CDP-diacylglycerol--serine O-phosphatidyltransferase [Burkholderiaceae bacterium]